MTEKNTDVLDRFWAFLEEQHPRDRIYLYDILTAYRGPDECIESLKKETTMLIRALAGTPIVVGHSDMNIVEGKWNGESVLEEFGGNLPWTEHGFMDGVDGKYGDVSWHFRSHAFRAFQSLTEMGRAKWKKRRPLKGEGEP